MRKGEKVIIGGIIVLAIGLMAHRGWQVSQQTEKDPGLPYYSTASNELKGQAAKLLSDLKCRECHVIWYIRDMTANVPAPPLDGIGSLKDEEWFFKYFSAENPQELLPTRLKEVYKMPSYAHLPEEERKVLAKYMASLKVEDWYLEETKKRYFEKLLGKAE